MKIRGFRIKPGEIEACLGAFAGVNDAVVLVREDEPGDKRLVAYYTAAAPLPIEALRAHLQGQLPDYMVPSAYVWLALMPLTANGKLDRKGLPCRMQARCSAVVMKRRKARWKACWRKYLAGPVQAGPCGPAADHFFELGGHSLLAVSLIERMRQAGLSADVRVLFDPAEPGGAGGGGGQ